MSSKNDFIPSKDGEFDVWFRNLTIYVIEKTGGTSPVWTHIPAEEVQGLRDAYAAWHGAYEPTLVPHTPGITEAKNEARKAAEGRIRPFKRRYLEDPPVTDQQRIDMGLHISHHPVPVPTPDTVPELIPDTGTRRRIAVHYRDEGSTHRGKPKNVAGIEVRWAFLDHAPVHLEAELIHSSFDTRSPLILDFDEADRGKRVYLAGRWEIHREGIKGLFGAVVDAIVP
ncbi:MAG: hypothetical protein LBD93_01245 [Treponema sp.]|jgi:hypothetical protein|nr:hypothetical protein [Treponema sp.]